MLEHNPAIHESRLNPTAVQRPPAARSHACPQPLRRRAWPRRAAGGPSLAQPAAGAKQGQMETDGRKTWCGTQPHQTKYGSNNGGGAGQAQGCKVGDLSWLQACALGRGSVSHACAQSQPDQRLPTSLKTRQTGTSIKQGPHRGFAKGRQPSQCGRGRRTCEVRRPGCLRICDGGDVLQ
jgi:hypothetical protein